MLWSWVETLPATLVAPLDACAAVDDAPLPAAFACPPRPVLAPFAAPPVAW